MNRLHVEAMIAIDSRYAHVAVPAVGVAASLLDDEVLGKFSEYTYGVGVLHADLVRPGMSRCLTFEPCQAELHMGTICAVQGTDEGESNARKYRKSLHSRPRSVSGPFALNGQPTADLQVCIGVSLAPSDSRMRSVLNTRRTGNLPPTRLRG